MTSRQNIGELFVPIKLDMKELDRELQGLKGRLQNVGRGMTDVGKKMTVGLTAPIVAIGGVSIKAAIDFESAFAGVRKTVDGTDEQFAKLEAGIRKMATEIPASTTEIAGVAEAAGQLGIKTGDILDFTRVMVDLGESTNLSANEAATQLARLANITGMSSDDFDKLGSTVVELGNNMATTEAEIVGMGMRLAAAGNQIGLTEHEILSFAGALSSVGIRAEAGGTAFSKVMFEMNTAVMDMGGELEQFAKVAGVSADDFAKAFREDPAQAILMFIKGLNRMQGEGANLAGTLDEMELGEIRVRNALLSAAGATDVFSDALDTGKRGWEENTALTKEAEQRYATMASQLGILKNKLTDVAIEIGIPLVKALKNVVDLMGPLLEFIKGLAQRFGDLSPQVQGIIIAIAGVAAAIGPVLIVLGMLVSSIGSIIAIAPVLGAAFTAMLGPVGLVIAAFAALVAAGILVWKNWDFIKQKAIEIWNKILDFFQTGIGKVVLAYNPLILAGLLIIGNWDTIKQAASDLWDFVKAAFASAIIKLKADIDNLVAFGKSIADAWEVTKRDAVELWNSVTQAFKDGVAAAKSVFSDLKQGAIDLWNALKDLFMNGINAVIGVLDTFLDAFPVLREAWELVKKAGSDLWNFLTDAFTAGINFITGIVNTWVGRFGDKMADLMGIARKVAGVFNDDLAGGIDRAIESLRVGMPAVETAEGQITDLGTETNITKESFVQIKPKIDETKGALDNVATSAGATTGAANTLKTSTDQLTESVEKSTEKVKAWNNEWIQSEGKILRAKEAGKELEAGTGRLSKVIDESINTIKKSWDSYMFKISEVGRFLDEHSVSTFQILQAISQKWGVTIEEVGARLADMRIDVNDTEKMVGLLGENGLRHLRLIVTGSDEASGGLNRMKGAAGQAASGFQSFAGKVVSGVNNIKAALRSMESQANSAFAAVGRANSAKIDERARGSRGNERGREGQINAELRTIQNAINQLKNTMQREMRGSGNPQAVRRQYEARIKDLEKRKSDLAKELRSIRSNDTGGIVKGPGVFRVGPGVQEIVRYHGRHIDARGGGEQTIIVELDGHMIARAVANPLVDEIRVRTGMRS